LSGSIDVFVMLSLLGENERALTVLEEAMAVPHERANLPWLPSFITVGDHFAGVVHDTRYKEALRTMNLEASAP
jgi:hypothetical protein